MGIELSIITVNLNNREGLLKTIQSVVSQTFTSFEYIIIDGGSTDGSVEIIREHSKSIEYWISESDNGIYNAMNKGILKAKGKYCYFLNSGDFLLDINVLKKVFRFSPENDILYCNVIIGEDKKNQIVKGPGTNYLSFSDILGTWCHQGMLIKRKLFDDIGLYDERFKISADWVFIFLALTIKGCSFQYYNINICNYDNTGISSNTRSWVVERNLVINKYIPPLIINEYNTGYYKIVMRLKQYRFSWFFVRILNKLVIIYDNTINNLTFIWKNKC